MSDTHAPALLVKAGRALYGADWQSPLARELGLNLRTVQRIAAAAETGAAYPIAPGVFAELAKALEAHSDDCRAIARDLAPYAA